MPVSPAPEGPAGPSGPQHHRRRLNSHLQHITHARSRHSQLRLEPGRQWPIRASEVKDGSSPPGIPVAGIETARFATTARSVSSRRPTSVGRGTPPSLARRTGEATGRYLDRSGDRSSPPSSNPTEAKEKMDRCITEHHHELRGIHRRSELEWRRQTLQLGRDDEREIRGQIAQPDAGGQRQVDAPGDLSETTPAEVKDRTTRHERGETLLPDVSLASG